jgi:pyridoxal phosphate enzyme (YggS family)
MLTRPQNSVPDSQLAANFADVRRRMDTAAAAAGRNVDSITLVAVSKGHGVEAMRAAAALGARDFGESYVQEALPKLAALRTLPVHWHFIGRIQANKTRAIAENFDWVHAIDRLRIAARLSAQRRAQAPPLSVCIEINIGNEPAKGGVQPADAAALAAAVGGLPNLRLRGLMCLLPEGTTGEAARAGFRRLRALLTELNRGGLALDTLSMGMSGDFVQAIGEGATLIRVGTALFGPRPEPAAKPLE